MLDKGRRAGTWSGRDTASPEGERPGRRAERPLPSTLRCLSLLILHNLLRKLDIAFRASRTWVVHEYRLAVTGSLSEANAAGNHSGKHLIVEKIPQNAPN